jgi:hypothetical protein
LSDDDFDADAPLESDEVLDSDDDLLSEAGFESLDVFAEESPDVLPLPLVPVALDSDESALPVAFLA